jgi:hypothetical protein
LLSKQHRCYQDLTNDEKKINLKFYGLNRKFDGKFYNILDVCRPPLLFYLKQKFETDSTTCERLEYDHFFIEYN